jgi:hypothetical protein
MDMPYHEHLLRREYNHHYTFHSVYAYAHALAYSFHELDDEASLVIIAPIFIE